MICKYNGNVWTIEPNLTHYLEKVYGPTNPEIDQICKDHIVKNKERIRSKNRIKEAIKNKQKNDKRLQSLIPEMKKVFPEFIGQEFQHRVIVKGELNNGDISFLRYHGYLEKCEGKPGYWRLSEKSLELIG